MSALDEFRKAKEALLGERARLMSRMKEIDELLGYMPEDRRCRSQATRAPHGTCKAKILDYLKKYPHAVERDIRLGAGVSHGSITFLMRQGMVVVNRAVRPQTFTVAE